MVSSKCLLKISTPRLQVVYIRHNKLSSPTVVLAPPNNSNSMDLPKMTKIMLFIILTNNI